MNKRPAAVTILAVVAVLGGGFVALSGIASLAIGAGAIGIAFAVFGALAIYVGWGLWGLRPAAWRLGVLLCVGAIVLLLIWFGASAFMIFFGESLHGEEWVYLGLFIGAALTYLLPVALILLALTSRGVRAAFGKPTDGGLIAAIKMALTGGPVAVEGAPANSVPPEPS